MARGRRNIKFEFQFPEFNLPSGDWNLNPFTNRLILPLTDHSDAPADLEKENAARASGGQHIEHA